MTIQQILTVQYQPRIVSPHIVETNVLRCEHQRNSPTQLCSVGEPQRAYFDDDASKYFTAAQGILLKEIVEVAHVIVHGEVLFAKGVQDPKLTSKRGLIGTVEKTDDNYLIHYGDCGCSGLMKLRKDGPESYTATQAGMRMCI